MYGHSSDQQTRCCSTCTDWCSSIPQGNKQKACNALSTNAYNACCNIYSYRSQVIGNIQKFQAGTGTFLVEGLQLIVAVFLIVLGIIVAITCIRKLVLMKHEKTAEKEA